jgi:hypothetical protein
MCRREEEGERRRLDVVRGADWFLEEAWFYLVNKVEKRSSCPEKF